MNKTFCGHGRLALFLNVVLAFTGPTYALSLFLAAMHGNLLRAPGMFMGIMALLQIGYPSYTMLEIKHLRSGDLGGGNRSLKAMVLFGLISLLGLILAIITLMLYVCTVRVLLIQYQETLAPYAELAILPLSFLSALACLLGLLDLTPYHLLVMVFFPREAPIIMGKAIHLLRSSWQLRFALVPVVTVILISASFLTNLMMHLY